MPAVTAPQPLTLSVALPDGEILAAWHTNAASPADLVSIVHGHLTGNDTGAHHLAASHAGLRLVNVRSLGEVTKRFADETAAYLAATARLIGLQTGPSAAPAATGTPATAESGR